MKTMKKYGIIVSDNGSNWYIQGTHDERWDDNELRALKDLQGSNFEAVDISSWLNHPNFNSNSALVPEANAEDIGTAIRENGTLSASIINSDEKCFLICETIMPRRIEVSIYNALGQTVFSETYYLGTGIEQIDISNSLISGVYFMRLLSKEGEESLSLFVE